MGFNHVAVSNTVLTLKNDLSDFIGSRRMSDVILVASWISQEHSRIRPSEP
jgi:hypothetical protein